MTDESILKYIELLNNKEHEDLIFIKQISSKVDFATVWPANPKENNRISSSASYQFFFIRNEEGTYVGAVLDMKEDLHWFIQPHYRKKGHLSSALRKAILPFIFKERNSQKITISRNLIGVENYNQSKKVAVSMGFKATNREESEFVLDKSEFDFKNESLKTVTTNISEERIEILKKRINFASKILLKISDELKVVFNDDYQLEMISNEVMEYTTAIEDMYWNNDEMS